MFGVHRETAGGPVAVAGGDVERLVIGRALAANRHDLDGAQDGNDRQCATPILAADYFRKRWHATSMSAAWQAMQ